MTRKLIAVVLAALLLFATPLAGGVSAQDAGNAPEDDPTAGNDAGPQVFGIQVSEFVDTLKDDNETSPIGPYVADFVTANNPGNAPDHAGPPAWLFGDDAEDNDTDDRGPPDHAGPGGDDAEDDENESDERGPPDHAGPGGDDVDDEENDDDADGEEMGDDDSDNGEEGEEDSDADDEGVEEEEDQESEEDDSGEEGEDDDDEEEADDDGDGERGPPEDAGPP